MVDWLSQWRVVGEGSGEKASLMKLQSQIAFLAACVDATYSASVVDRVTSSCF